MGNKKHEQRSRKRKAPADPSTGFDESLNELNHRGVWGWLATGLKMGLGIGLIGAFVFGISWGVYRYAKTTPRFSVKNIRIEGTKRLARDDILGAAHLEVGSNLFSLDVDAAQRALVKSPWVERARVTRKLPNTVFIEVAEREARATLVIAGKSFLVGEQGEPFKETGSGDPHDLPLITGASLEALAANRELERERIRDILGLLRSYEHLGIAKDYPAEEVHLEDSGSATLIVGARGTELHLGPPPFKQRLLRAERILTKTLRKGATPSVVFLDNEAHPERVVVRVQ